MKYIINPGEFRHKIEIQSLTIEKVNQRPIEKWESIFTTKAKTIKSKSSEELLLGGKTDKIAKKLIIRTPKRFELTNDYRVLFKGQ
ncbi:MAG: phage head closure protein, partial [Clostridium sp.]